MEFGICMFVTNYSMQAADLAQAVEERDFDALFIPDHTHIPASRQSPFTIGEELPPDYSHNVDVFLALAAAAAVTKRIRLGTGICLVVERDPIITAKEVASLDHMSGGRFDFGIGGGWNQEEMENHGMPWKRRWKVLRERVEAMQAIWTQDKASYDGEFVKFDRIFSWPKPVQKPHPPIYVGGDAPGTFKRILSYGDGWIPMLAEQENTFDLKTERMAELATLANEAGRAPYPITTFGTPRDPNAISRLATQGVTRCIFGIKAAPTEDVLPRLDKISRMVSEVRTGDG
jgi:probable F420-dependent oxidoreductase